MKEFSFVVKDNVGIHARPAGLLVRKASEYKSSVTIKKGDKSADAKRLFAIMSLAAKCGDKITFTINGEDEAAAAQGLLDFCNKNL